LHSRPAVIFCNRRIGTLGDQFRHEYKDELTAISLIFALAWSAPAEANCAVPHVISNGQVADAAKVMENLDALKNCVEAVQGNSGSGSGWDFAPPAAVMFPIFASGDATNLTLSDDAEEGLLVDSGTLVTGDKFRTATKTLPASGAADWTVSIKYKAAGPGNANTGVGLVAREGATGKHASIIFNTSGTPAMFFMRGTPSSWGTVMGVMQAQQRVGWLKLTYVHSTGVLSAFWGTNGKQWQRLGSVMNATAFTTRADQVGFVDQSNVAGGTNFMSVPYWI
jgi:hypothetical protein